MNQLLPTASMPAMAGTPSGSTGPGAHAPWPATAPGTGPSTERVGSGPERPQPEDAGAAAASFTALLAGFLQLGPAGQTPTGQVPAGQSPTGQPSIGPSGTFALADPVTDPSGPGRSPATAAILPAAASALPLHPEYGPVTGTGLPAAGNTLPPAGTVSGPALTQISPTDELPMPSSVAGTPGVAGPEGADHRPATEPPATRIPLTDLALVRPLASPVQPVAAPDGSWTGPLDGADGDAGPVPGQSADGLLPMGGLPEPAGMGIHRPGPALSGLFAGTPDAAAGSASGPGSGLVSVSGTGTGTTALPLAPPDAGGGLPALRPLADAGAWSTGLADRLISLHAGGLQSARLQLHPEHLGALDVQIVVEDGTAQVWFGTSHPQTREAIESALPRLRDMFAEQGLQLLRAQVDSGQQQRQPLPTPVPEYADGGIPHRTATAMPTGLRSHTPWQPGGGRHQVDLFA